MSADHLHDPEGPPAPCHLCRYRWRSFGSLLPPDSPHPEHFQKHEPQQRRRNRLLPAKAREHRVGISQ